VRKILTLAVVALVFTSLAILSVRKSDEPRRAIAKWLLTLLLSLLMYFYIWPMTNEGGQTTFSAIGLTVACGLIMLVTWRNELGTFLLEPITSLYDGGGAPPEPRPLYSIAQAKQKRGHYQEAVLEIQKQLVRFPTDLEGHILQAQIQAENLQDLPGAYATIQAFCAQPGHAPKNIAFALSSLADWQLQFGADQQAARRSLEQIITQLPETEFALVAAQRIAHLGSPEMMLPPTERHKYTVPESIRRFGLVNPPEPIKPAEKDPAQLAVEYVRHLEQYPLDAEAREQLASIYADHYNRLDLATDQLEQLVQQPNRPPKLVTRWLNLLADLQIRSGADYETVKQTLQRIIDLAPEYAAAANARKRIGLLKLELKGKQLNEDVKLGTYEQNLGLKGQGTRPRPGQ